MTHQSEFTGSKHFGGAERRREQRHTLEDVVEVFAIDARSDSFLAKAIVRDVSRSGVCVHMPVKTVPGVRIRLVNANQSVEAVVRHCGAAFGGYLVGMEFTDSPDPSGWSTLPATW